MNKKINTLLPPFLRQLNKIFMIGMRISILLICIGITNAYANKANAQNIDINLKDASIITFFKEIEEKSNFVIIYKDDVIKDAKKVTILAHNTPLENILDNVLPTLDLEYSIINRQIIINKVIPTNNTDTNIVKISLQYSLSGTITDSKGVPLPGASIIEKGTSNGVQSDFDGNFSLDVGNENAILVISYIGFITKEIPVNGQNTINVKLLEDIAGLDEVVVIGYGTQRKKDLTGAVTRVDMEDYTDLANVTVAQSLQGSVAGLNVGQVAQAGGQPGISIRGRTSISGEQSPLIILDDVIYRGNLIDINPNDIKSIDILKDNSAAAVYGSQAANGVVIISTLSKSRKRTEKPVINYSVKYSAQSPIKELKPGNAAYFIERISDNEWRESRTAASGYIEPNPDWNVTSLFKTNEQVDNYLAGVDTDWYGLLTNNQMFVNDHNLSVANQTENGNYFISLGYTDQQGYMINEGYERLNARINVDTDITDWLTVGVQSFVSSSDYSGQSPSLESRYTMPFEVAYKDGELNPFIENAFVSPLVFADSENKDIRQNLFGNIYAKIEFPFLKGLSYKINVANNQVTNRFYAFEPFAENFQGRGEKYHSINNDLSSNHNLTFKRRFDNHNLELTLVYGTEERKQDFTRAIASIFVNDVLGYNKLDFGSSELQQAQSGAFSETSLFTMGRLFYGFKDRYLLTATLRRDGFSGLSEGNKFQTFPSASIGWVVSEEPFYKNESSFMDYLKLRLSYGSSGNRTVGRYQTLARTNGGFNYVDANGSSIYTQSINSLASPKLTWETTTGINVGIDFGLLDSKITGSLNYYNNNTEDLFYIVDIPAIGRYDKFPDNLGKIHNSGFEATISSTNIQTDDFSWTSNFSFSRNRDELKELLGADNDGDGIEDDLISEGLFIGEPLNSIYDYELTGEKYQLGDDVPSGFDVGNNIIVNQNPDDGDEITQADDRIILGYEDPSYRFGINNQFRYKNFTLSAFINSVQGGKNYYMRENNLHELQYGDQYNTSYPLGYDNYWLPENPDAKYQKKSNGQQGSLRGKIFQQRSFVRLQDVTLGYTFPREILNRIKVSSLRLFISGKNLATWTKWEGWDPETGQGINRVGRPVLKSYTLGLNIEL
tara:strand:+ start:75120 stop:78479 length:3360 start_codon:yes stop_codon:yes gene_type:complete